MDRVIFTNNFDIWPRSAPIGRKTPLKETQCPNNQSLTHISTKSSISDRNVILKSKSNNETNKEVLSSKRVTNSKSNTILSLSESRYPASHDIQLTGSFPSNYLTDSSGDIFILSSSPEDSEEGESPNPLNSENPIMSPHSPPFEVHMDLDNQKRTITQTIIDQQNSRLFSNTDYFQEYMEDRLVRWRPSDSQFNVDATMNGNHPYQQNEEADSKTNNMLQSLIGWFGNERKLVKVSRDLENQASNVLALQAQQNHTSTYENQSSHLIKKSGWYPMTPDFPKMLSKIELKANSSNSILPKVEFNKLMKSSCITYEPNTLQEPIYTAKGIPFSEFELNFEKENNNRVDDYIYGHNSSQNMDSLDEDVRNLIEGIDNFLVVCFAASWSYVTSASSYCQGFF